MLKGDIPLFPNFVPIGQVSKKAVDSYTKKHAPYATFNYLNAISWDIYDNRSFSLLFGNLILQSFDNDKNEIFLTILGTKRLKETSVALHKYINKKNASTVLRLVPEETACALEEVGFKVTEDIDSSEYLYETTDIAHYKKSTYKQKLKDANGFKLKFPKTVFKCKDISDPSTKLKLIQTMLRWEHKKRHDNKPLDSEAESAAITRFLLNPHAKNVLLTCLFDKDQMIAFSVDEILSTGFTIAHFVKADTDYKGIYEYMNKRTATALLKRGGEYWNWQQDLGIQGLRKLKQSYKPIKMLRKYNVDLN